MSTAVKNAGYLLQSISVATNVRAVGDGVLVPGNPWFTYHNCDGWELGKGLHESLVEGTVWPPVPDWSQWNGVSNVADFLNAIDDFPDWSPTSGSPSVMGYATRPAHSLAGNNNYFMFVVADWMLPYVSGQIGGLEPSWLKYLPPIWPGLEFVASQTPHNVTGAYHGSSPCNGVVVEITTTPPEMSTYDWGEITQYPRAGYISFTNDGDCLEDPQPITYPKHIICPKLVRLASGFYIRPHAGVEMTVTAWTYYTP